MSFPTVFSLKGMAIAFAAGIAVGGSGGLYAAHVLHQAQRVAPLKAVIKQERKAVAVTSTIGARAAVAQGQVRTNTVTIIRKVPSYVSAQADARCVVPRGFVRVFNAGAQGLSDVPDAPGQSDDAPSGVALSDVAATSVVIAGAYHEQAEVKLVALQDWVRAQQALAQH